MFSSPRLGRRQLAGASLFSAKKGGQAGTGVHTRLCRTGPGKKTQKKKKNVCDYEVNKEKEEQKKRRFFFFSMTQISEKDGAVSKDRQPQNKNKKRVELCNMRDTLVITIKKVHTDDLARLSVL